MTDIGLKHILPDGWSRARGYSHCVLAGGIKRISIAGQTAGGTDGSAVSDGMTFADQWTAALGKVATLVREAGGEPTNITAMRIYVTDMAAYKTAGAELGPGWSAAMGKHFPAITLVEVRSLVDPNAMVEIEAEALLA
ncbi:RidA family protein [Thermodesulfobacteriota bacterium]